MTEPSHFDDPRDRSPARAALALALDDQQRLRSFFEERGLDAHAAEDCVQDVFVRLLRARADAPGRRGFLRVLARSALVDWFRRARLRVHAEADDRPAPGADPGLRLDLEVAIARLPAGQRDVVLLALVEGRRYADVAARLGVPEGTVKSRMYHAVRALREALGDG